MYPNPQDVLPLPPRPSVEQYRKRAKDLVKACRSGEDAVRAWVVKWVDTLFALHAATPEHERGQADLRAQQIAGFARDRLIPAECSLSQAQFVLARVHGFTSWPRLVRHIGNLAGSDPALSAFEQATDAIVGGDLVTLRGLLAAQPELVRERSSREHRATLLHYVSANGVENFRQKTPENIVEITRALLDAGAEVDAVADVYGGGATTLGLVVTSAHPRAVGVQNQLADLLLERGARMDAGIVGACLANGCPEAAAHLADRGAPLDLEEAAGLGRLDLVARQLEPRRTVSGSDATRALLLACWYDQREVVALLLDRGVDVGVRDQKDGSTALHIAAYTGSSGLVELLLERGAPVDVKDGVYSTPPVVWALHGWLVEGRANETAYRDVLFMLARAGTEVKPEWLGDERLRADGELHAALSRRIMV